MGLLVLMPWVWQRGLNQMKTKHLRGHLLRRLAGLAAMYGYFYAIAHLPLAEATLLNYSTPLFVPFIAAIAGEVFWGEIPDILFFAGAVLVRLAGILTIRFAGKRLLPEVNLVRR